MRKKRRTSAMVVLGAVLICVPTAPLSADIIYMKNGDVYLGKANVANAEGININNFGKNTIIKQRDILKIDTGNNILEEKQYDIILSDDSILHGNIKNYDEEIGVFLKAAFGDITIPASGIKEIHDSHQRNLYYGEEFQLGFCGGYYLPFGNFNTDFDSSYIGTAFAETNSRMLRGLTYGLRFSYLAMEYMPSSEVTYRGYGIALSLAYHYGDWRLLTLPVVNRLTPLLRLDVGGTYLAVADAREDAVLENRNEMIPTASLVLGIDVLLGKGIVLRLEGGAMTLYQRGFYSAVMAGGGVMYNFSL